MHIVNMRPSQVPKHTLQENVIDKRSLVVSWLGTWHKGQRGHNRSEARNYSYNDKQSCDKFESF
jgi:hypothetical protein